MNPFRQLISDGAGELSTMRVMSLAVVVPVMIVWTVLSIRQNTFIVPDAKIITLVGTAMGSKALQSFSENFSPATKTPNQI
jgi:hypothetical protein